MVFLFISINTSVSSGKKKKSNVATVRASLQPAKPGHVNDLLLGWRLKRKLRHPLEFTPRGGTDILPLFGFTLGSRGGDFSLVGEAQVVKELMHASCVLHF